MTRAWLAAVLIVLAPPRARAADALAATCGALYQRVVYNGFADYEQIRKDPDRGACTAALAKRSTGALT